ncbi:MAG: hypothetical protein AAF226_00790 [Verrucomicrobiota bacterium]
MKLFLQPNQRSELSRGGRWVSAFILFILGVGILFVQVDPQWVGWVFSGIAFAGFFTSLLWRTQKKQELEEEDLVEITRQAVRSEAERLDKKRGELERVLMSYGEWMEFPDFKKLQEVDWLEEASRGEQVVHDLLNEESDAMLAKFSAGEYWADGKFQTRFLLSDLLGFMERIASHYNPSSDRPILETNLESLLKAVNRASLQVILLLEELPLFDVKEMNLRKAADGVRKASKVYKTYEDVKPFLEPVRYLLHGSKFLMASNPLLAAGWIAGSEVVWKGGKKLGKKALDAYLLSLVRQSLGIVAWETAGIYDPAFRYRSPDWAFGVELVHLMSEYDPDRQSLQKAFKELGGLPLKSSFDRVFLYRCLVNGKSPKPKHFKYHEWMSGENLALVKERVIEFSQSEREEITPERYEKWLKQLDERL